MTYQDEFTNLPTIEHGSYRHYKGSLYRVLGVGRHSESDDYFVIYTLVNKQPGQPEMWVRPYDMFVSTVEVDGQTIPRFKKVEESE